MPSVIETRVRVRFEECDYYQHVNNGVYQSYLDVGIGDFLRQVYPDLRDLKFMIHKVHASIDYIDSATFEDQLLIKTYIQDVGNTSITFEHEIMKGDALILTAKIIFVMFNVITGEKCSIPEELSALI